MKFNPRFSLRLFPATLFVVGAGVVLFIAGRRALRAFRTEPDFHMDGSPEGSAYPKAEGAVSAVTGGNPEDMNYMPASGDFEAPVYDGSDLSRRKAV